MLKNVLVFKRFLKGQGSHEYARESLQPSEPEYFGALLGSLLDTLGSLLHDLGYMMVSLESFWSNFKKHLFFQRILMILCVYGVNWEVTLASFLAYGGALEPYLRQVDVERHEMASMMGIYAGLVGPKSENVFPTTARSTFLEGHRGYGYSAANLQRSEPNRLEGVRSTTLLENCPHGFG